MLQEERIGKSVAVRNKEGPEMLKKKEDPIDGLRSKMEAIAEEMKRMTEERKQDRDDTKSLTE